MKRSKLLALSLVATVALSVGLISTHSKKAFADTLSDVPGYTQHNNAPLPKATETPISLYRSNNISNNFYIYNIPGVQRIQYGTSGEGRPLYYYKIGNGPNTLFANFAIHGFEDSWAQDGYQLTKIAHQLIEKFNTQNKEGKLGDWSIIIVPCANPDGVLDGWTNNGPGRAQISKHIDLNRDFPTYFIPQYDARNYTGPHPLGAPEAQALATLVPKISRESRNMVLLDVHGWLDMTIGDPQIGRYFINNLGLSRNAGYIPAGHGYFISYGHAEGAEVSLVELPDTTSASQVTSRNYVGKMYTAMNQLMNDGTGLSYINKTGVVVNTSKLHIRSGATTDGSILGSLSEGQSVHILGSINGWYKIYQPGIGYAYVSGNYIKITGNGSSIPSSSTGWQTINGHKYYFDNNGNKVTGWNQIGSSLYYFDNTGVMQTGWHSEWGVDYYFDPSNGAMVKGLRTINGQEYYFNNAGIKQTDWQNINGNWYYFNSNGTMRKNQWLKQSNGQTFYLGPNGIKYTGTHVIDNATYIFNSAGILQRKWEVINGSYHVFNQDNVMLKGWLEEWGAKYYFDPSSGAMYKGTHVIDNATYIFGNNGVLQRKWEIINGSYHVFNPSNVMLKGWINEWGATYYFNPSNGAMVKDFRRIDNKTYFFDAQGIMQTGWHTINNKVYKFNDQGIMQIGWVHEWGVDYYFDPSSGAMVKGFRTINGQEYYFNNAGIKQVGLQNINGQEYYFNNAGVKQVDWQNINGNWYYFNSNGTMRKNEWLKQSNGQTFYLGSNGIKCIGTHVIDNATYIFNSAGILQRKWEVINGSYHVFNPNNVMLKGWINEWGATYYFDLSSGAMYKGKHVIDNVTYIFGNDGVLQRKL